MKFIVLLILVSLSSFSMTIQELENECENLSKNEAKISDMIDKASSSYKELKRKYRGAAKKKKKSKSKGGWEISKSDASALLDAKINMLKSKKSLEVAKYFKRRLKTSKRSCKKAKKLFSSTRISDENKKKKSCKKIYRVLKKLAKSKTRQRKKYKKKSAKVDKEMKKFSEEMAEVMSTEGDTAVIKRKKFTEVAKKRFKNMQAELKTFSFSDAMENIKGQYNQALKAWDELPDNWSKSKKSKKDFVDACVKIEKFNFK